MKQLVHNRKDVCPEEEVKIESAGEIVRNTINDLIRDLKNLMQLMLKIFRQNIDLEKLEF